MDPLTAATLISGGIGIADNLFSKKKKPDMRNLENALAILRKRTENQVSGTLGRLRAGGIDPRSGLAQETANAVRSSLAPGAEEARALFEQQSLLNQPPEDESTSDLISSLVLNLGTAKYGQGKGAAAQQPISLLDPRKVKMKQNLGDYGRYAPSRFGAYA